MPKFRPFRGLLYNEPGSGPEDGVMDVSSVLGQHLDPVSIESKMATGLLIEQAEPAIYLLRAGRRDADGTPVQASGVFGVIEPLGTDLLSVPTVIDVKNFEFDLLLTLTPPDMPVVTATDADGTHYRLWAVTQAGVISTIADAIEPVTADASGLVIATNDVFEPPVGLVFARP